MHWLASFFLFLSNACADGNFNEILIYFIWRCFYRDRCWRPWLLFIFF